MRDVQPFGNGLETSKLNDLCPLHRGDSQVGSGVAFPLIGEQSDKPQVAIPLTSSPNGGFGALELCCKVFSPLACRDAQNNEGTTNNASPPNLIPRRRVAVRDPLQLDNICSENGQHFRLASTHADVSHTETEYCISIEGHLNLVHVLVPPTLGAADG